MCFVTCCQPFTFIQIGSGHTVYVYWYVSICFILHTNYHALINELISHIVPYIHQIIAYSLVSGSMKRQDIVAYFSVRIVKTRWTHVLYPNSRLLTLLRDQNFPSWRTRFEFPAEATYLHQRELLGLGRQIEPKCLVVFGVFSVNSSTPILVLWVSCYHNLYKKLSLYIQFPKKYLGLGFEFEPQWIRDLAIVCL